MAEHFCKQFLLKLQMTPMHSIILLEISQFLFYLICTLVLMEIHYIVTEIDFISTSAY